MNAKWTISAMFATLIGLCGAGFLRAQEIGQTTAPAVADTMSPYGDGQVTSLEGSTFQGLGTFAHGAGTFNYNTAQAIKTMQEARMMAIQNHRLAVENWYELKELNRELRADELQTPTQEEIDRVMDLQRPERLTLDQYRPATGELNWPVVLMGDQFIDDREILEELFVHRTSRDVGADSLFQWRVRRVTERMLDKLRDRIDELTPNEFLAGKKFLVGLQYEALAPAHATALASR